MKKSLMVILVFVIFLSFTACKKDTSPQTVNNNETMTLTIKETVLIDGWVIGVEYFRFRKSSEDEKILDVVLIFKNETGKSCFCLNWKTL